MRDWRAGRRHDMNRIEWLKERRAGIGGSDVAAILGMNPWKSAVEVYAEKVSEEEPTDDEISEAAKWGTLLEPIIAHQFIARNPGFQLVKPSNAIKIHSKHDWLRGSADYLLITPDKVPSGLECKTANERYSDLYEAGELPDFYMLQVQHYLEVFDLPEWWVSCLVGGQRQYDMRVVRDEELYKDYIMPKLAEFWDHVKNRTVPAVDGSESCSKTLGRIWQAKKGVSVTLANAHNYAREYFRACEDEKQAKERKERIANEIKAQMGEATSAIVPDPAGGPGFKFSWPQVEGSMTFDADAFCAAHPDLHKQFLTKQRAGYRRFTATEVKIKKGE